jgi:hypothetical protein
MTLPSLRTVLLADAAASGAAGLLMLAGAGVLSGWFGIPAPLLRGAGLVLLPFAALVGWLGRRGGVPRGAVLAVVAANAAWVAASLVVLGGPWFVPTALGTAFVALQAALVAVFAVAQAWAAGLARRTAAA